MDVRTICLGILSRGDHTGYEIKKHFEIDGFFVEPSFGSIYPALNKLTEDGLVLVRAEAQLKRPDRKIYSITPAGRRVFLDALMQPLAEDRYRSPFLFAMLFADLLPAPRVDGLFEEFVAQAQRRLAQLPEKSDVETEGERFVLDFGRTMYITMLDYLRQQRAKFADVVPNAAE
ncbi:MAG: PadR family transcriptional regulator [Alphaproteobacteria bacterium]|nr:PadR family transcriptional regulator [Alphaproteobacteria bacterium]